MESLASNQADVALLGIYLQDGSCEHVAQRRIDLGIPLVVFSRSDPTEDTIDALSGDWRSRHMAEVRRGRVAGPV